MNLQKIKKHIASKIDFDAEVKLSPNSKFGDFTVECFEKEKNLAQKLADKIKPDKIIQEINSVGPYLNFSINYKFLVQNIFKNKYKKNNILKNKKLILEYAHPNTHKEFHIGHLRNIITGESLARILENAGYKIIRANYQGDIGLHVAKCLWAYPKFKDMAKAYVAGNTAYEEDEKAKKEIEKLNQKIYNQDKFIKKFYLKTRKQSLEYFDKIYKKLGVKFDRLYFESEVFEQGKKIVLKNLKNKIFEQSQGAIIFKGKKYKLHNRVFINSQGNATYEAKELGLAKLQFKEYNPEKIIHLVGPEQTEYFKVVFKALELVMPKSKNREKHLSYGWVQLKKGKMSSRKGNVVLAEWLINQIKKQGLKEKTALAAIKYSILKSSRLKNIFFNIKESISLSGESGPYLQYAYARIKSILRQQKPKKLKQIPELTSQEKKLIFKLALYPEITNQSAQEFEPSLIAKYLFELAQEFSEYYHKTPILKSKDNFRNFRLNLIDKIALTLKHGLYLLGIEVLDKM